MKRFHFPIVLLHVSAVCLGANPIHSRTKYHNVYYYLALLETPRAGRMTHWVEASTEDLIEYNLVAPQPEIVEV